MNGHESPGELPPSLAVYNPALLKKEDLIAQFVVRWELLDRLVEELRRGGENGHQHHLLVGPRGSGKTTLLRRLRYAIEDDAELSSRWLPLVFPEEQYNVSRLSDLWVNCLEALSDMLERGNRKDEAEALDRQIDRLSAAEEEHRAQAALDLLIGRAKKLGRQLVLLFDNLDLILDRLKEDHQAIREILSTGDHLLFIGATNAPIEAVYDREGEFYDFFKTHELRGLSDRETREVIFNLARLRRAPQVIEALEREPGRIRALNLLTGGNLRTIVVLYQALAHGKDDSIRADLEQLLDQYTPLYKHRFESLSAQSQQVVDALALNWDPATAAELAEKLRMETNAVSAVLNRLDHDGIVEKVPSPPGEKMFFQIAERFFNIWYLMRASRRVRRKLIWLVEFLKMFYGAAELNRRARHLVQEPAPPEYDQSQRAELALLFAGAVEKPDLRRALETEGIRSLMSCGIEARQRLNSMLDLEGEDASLKDMVERFQSLSELGAKIEQAKDQLPREFWEYLITAPALSLEEKKKTFDDVAKLGSDESRQWIEKFESEAKSLVDVLGAEPCRELFDAIRDGHMADGADVEGADAAAIAGKDPSLRVIARLFRFDRTNDKTLLDQARGILTVVRSPQVWLSWAETLVGSEFFPSAVTSNDKKKIAAALKRMGRLNSQDARAWRRVGELLFHLGRESEAESAYRKSIALEPDASTSWNDFGYFMAYMRGSFDEAEAAYRKAIELDPKSASPWFRLGDLLQRYLNRYEEAEAAFRKATELAPNQVLPWGFLVQLLMHELKKYEEAEVVCRKAIEHHPDNSGLLMNLCHVLGRNLNKYEEAEAACRKAIELFPDDVNVWRVFGDILLYPLKKYEEAVEVFRKVIELDPGAQNALGNLGNALRFTGKYEEAEEVFRRAIELEPNAAWHWMNLAALLERDLKRHKEVEFAYRKAIEIDPNAPMHWMRLGAFLECNQRKPEEAQAAFQRALDLASKRPHPWDNRGALLEHLKRYEEAEAAYRNEIELRPNEEGRWVALGRLLADHLNRPEEAEAAYRKAIELKPNDSGFWNLLGILLADQLKKYDESEAVFRKGGELDPNTPWPWFYLGRLLQNHLNRYEEAETAYRKAIELDPKNASLRMSLGMLLEDCLKRNMDAEAAYRQAIALDPDDAWSWFHLGRLLLRNLRRYEEAEAIFRKAVELAPDEATMWMLSGEALIRLEKYEEAEAACRKVIELNPNMETINSAWANLGLISQASGRYEDMETAIRRAIWLNPNNSRHWMNLGGLLADHLKRYDEAEEAYRQAINLSPSDTGPWILLGKLLANHLNRPDEAQEAFRKAVELDDNKAESEQRLAWRESLPNILDKAKSHSRLLIGTEDDVLHSSCMLACFFIRRGGWDDAVIYARKFISEGTDELHEQNWQSVIRFFQDAVASGHANEAMALLDETEYGERWRPLRVALQAIVEDDSSCLLRVAPEIRQPAEEIVALLLPAGVRLGAPKNPRARRTRRKKSQD